MLPDELVGFFEHDADTVPSGPDLKGVMSSRTGVVSGGLVGAVVAAGDDAEESCRSGCAVFGDRHGGVARAPPVSTSTSASVASGRQVRVADHEAGLAVLDAARPSRASSSIDWEPKTNERPPQRASAIARSAPDDRLHQCAG